MRKKARSKSTFDGHQRNNERLILYLYEHNVEILVDELRRALDDANAEPDYSDVVRRHPQYVRRNLERRQMAGPLSLESIVDAVQTGPVMTGMAADIALG